MNARFGRCARLIELLVLTGLGAALIGCESADREPDSAPLPEGTPVGIAANAVVGIRRNEVDVVTVRVHPLERR